MMSEDGWRPSEEVCTRFLGSLARSSDSGQVGVWYLCVTSVLCDAVFQKSSVTAARDPLARLSATEEGRLLMKFEWLRWHVVSPELVLRHNIYRLGVEFCVGIDNMAGPDHLYTFVSHLLHSCAQIVHSRVSDVCKPWTARHVFLDPLQGPCLPFEKSLLARICNIKTSKNRPNCDGFRVFLMFHVFITVDAVLFHTWVFSENLRVFEVCENFQVVWGFGETPSGDIVKNDMDWAENTSPTNLTQAIPWVTDFRRPQFFLFDKKIIFLPKNHFFRPKNHFWGQNCHFWCQKFVCKSQKHDFLDRPILTFFGQFCTSIWFCGRQVQTQKCPVCDMFFEVKICHVLS